MGKGVNGNLKTLDEIDPKEDFAIRSKGGKASVCAQRKRKEFKETLLELLEIGQTQEEIDLIAKQCKKTGYVLITDEELEGLVNGYSSGYWGSIYRFNQVRLELSKRKLRDEMIKQKAKK